MKNLKAESIWSKITLDKTFSDLVISFREKFFIPSGGFKNDNDYHKWLEAIVKNKRVQRVIEKDLNELKNYEFGLDLTGMYWVLDQYIHFGVVAQNSLFTANTTGCELILINKDNEERQKERIEKGYIYIKMSPTSRSTDIELFLKQNKKRIITLKKILLEESGKQVKNPKFRTPKYENRDTIIHELDTKDSKTLSVCSGLVGIKATKYIKIKRILEDKFGYKLDVDNIRKICERMRKATNKPIL